MCCLSESNCAFMSWKEIAHDSHAKRAHDALMLGHHSEKIIRMTLSKKLY